MQQIIWNVSKKHYRDWLDADLVIFRPSKKHTISVNTHHMNVDYSSYEGWELTGKYSKQFFVVGSC